MRKLVMFALYLLPLVSLAQVRIAIRGGIQFSSVYDSRMGGFIPRINTGIQLEFPLNDDWFIYSGLYYSGKGARSGHTYLSNKQDSLTTRLNYIELPILFAYQFGDGNNDHTWVAGGGPFVGYGFLGSEKWKGGRPASDYHLHKKENEWYRRFEWGLGIFSQHEFTEKWDMRIDLASSLFSVKYPANGKQKNIVAGLSFLYHFN